MGLCEQYWDGGAGGVAEDVCRGEVEGGDEVGEVAGVEVPVVLFGGLDGGVGPGEAAGVGDYVEVGGEDGEDGGEATKVREVAVR